MKLPAEFKPEERRGPALLIVRRQFEGKQKSLKCSPLKQEQPKLFPRLPVRAQVEVQVGEQAQLKVKVQLNVQAQVRAQVEI